MPIKLDDMSKEEVNFNRIDVKNSIGKYGIGTTVFAKAIPHEELIIRRFVTKIYYCRLTDNSDDNDVVYFEHDLMSAQEKKTLMTSGNQF